MKRGDIYRLERPSKRDPKRFRVYVVVSRSDLYPQPFQPSFALVYSNYIGLQTEIEIGIAEGLKHDSSVRCDELVSIARSELTNFIGSLSPDKILELNLALKAALEVD